MQTTKIKQAVTQPDILWPVGKLVSDLGGNSSPFQLPPEQWQLSYVEALKK